MIEILLEIQNVMDNLVVFGLGLVGLYYTATGISGLKPEKPKKRKITVTKNTDKNKAA